MTTSISLRLTYNDFFEETDSIENLLVGFTKNDLFRATSLLNSKVRQNQDSINTIIDWFSSAELRDDLVKKVSKKESHIINTYSNLTLLSYLLDCDDSDIQISTNEFELNLFKIYLLINSQQDSIENKSFPKIKDLETEEKLSASLLQMSYYSYDLDNYILQEVFLCQLIKSIEFFKYMETNLSNHLELFLKKYKCEDWQEWIKKLLNIIILILGHDDSQFSEVKLDDNHIEEIGGFLELFRRNFDLPEKPDFIELRSNPLYKFNSSTYIIINKLFLIERIFKSVTFEFSLEINKDINDKFKIKDFRAEYCNNFSEETIFYEMIHNSFPDNSKFKKISGTDFKNVGYDIGEPDYYVRFKNKVLLFESKDVILTGKEKQSRDYSTLKEVLREKFLKTTNKKGKIEEKAILQLISNIKRVFSKFYNDIDSEYDDSNVKIYPYLVTHDRQFDTPELNRLINRWFRSEIEKTFNKEQQKRIYNLTILNIDSILLNQESFRKRGLNSLEILTKKYHESIKPIKYSTNEEIEQHYLDTSLSFYTYLGRHFDKTNRNRPSFIDDYLKLLNID